MKMDLNILHELESKLDEFSKENGEVTEQDAPIKNKYCFGCEGSCTTHCVGSCMSTCSGSTK